MSGSSPYVSVIMPVFNAAAYLGDSIGSVLAQNFPDFELICFNDASTDNSLEILNRYAAIDPRVKVIDSPVNVKQGAGRNHGIKEARGRYVLFLDADDALSPGALRCLHETACGTDAEVVFFDYLEFAPSTGKETQRRTAVPSLTHPMRPTPVWTAMYSRRLFTDYTLFFPKKVFYEDNAVALALQLVAENPVHIGKPLYRYRCDNPSVTRSSNNMRFFDRVDSATLLLGHIKRLGLYDRYADDIDFIFINQYLVHTVFGAIYRFDRVQTDRIAQVRDGIGEYITDFRRNPHFKAQSLSWKLKLETHMRWPRFIKMLSNINRRLKTFFCRVKQMAYLCL